jgi:hypothetical protein
MANIKSKDSFSWSKGSSSYSYNQRGNDGPVSLSKIVTDIRKLQRLLSISLNALEREDLTDLKKDISYLQHSISENISKKDVPSNIDRDYQNLNEDVREKISEIDKKILF